MLLKLPYLLMFNRYYFDRLMLNYGYQFAELRTKLLKALCYWTALNKLSIVTYLMHVLLYTLPDLLILKYYCLLAIFR